MWKNYILPAAQIRWEAERAAHWPDGVKSPIKNISSLRKKSLMKIVQKAYCLHLERNLSSGAVFSADWQSPDIEQPNQALDELFRTLSHAGLHKLWYPGIRDRSTWGKFGAHGEHGDVFLFSNLGAL